MSSNLDRTRLYRKDGERRWERLKAEMLAVGEVGPEQLDFSPRSLRVVWGWVLSRLCKRPAGEPLDPERQPPWWDGPTWGRYAGWDDATHDLVGAVAWYFGEVCVRRPGASWGVGLPQSSDEGEPVIEDERVLTNPLVMVLNALADVWDGKPDPESLMRLALYVPEPMPLELLYPPRLTLRLRGRPAGVWRRLSGLDRARVSEILGRLLDVEGAGGPAVDIPGAGRTEQEYRGEWRAGIEIDGAAGGVREVRAVIGAGWSEPRPSKLTRKQIRAFVDGFVALAAELGGQVKILNAQPNDMHATQPHGVLTPNRVPEVLDTIDLGPRQQRR